MSNMLSKVRALLDTAESFENEGNAAAAATYRGKAEELMVKYRIEEETIAKDETAILPITFDIKLTGPSPYRQQYISMFEYIARHTGLMVKYDWKWDTSIDGYSIMAMGVGYASDVEYAEALYTQARLVFVERLEPRIKPDLDDQTNVYRLRSAGIERVRIAKMMWDSEDKLFLSRVGRLYKAECQARGEEPALSGRGVTGAAYREQYSDQFVYTLAARLRQAQDSAGRAGGGLVLHGRAERVSEAFYKRFPKPAELPPAEEQAPCEKCAKAKSGQCREHHVSHGRAPKGRDYYSTAAERGREAGAAAARSVALRRGGTDSIGG